jgi:glucosyl-3-phosphoglycerate synthase
MIKKSKTNKSEEWFKNNTYNCEDFSDIEELVKLKKKQNLKISCGIPTLNEEDTIGNVIKTIKDSLMKKHHLLEEIAIFDSGSKDKTVSIAKNAGAKVYQQKDFLDGRIKNSEKREEGILKGKGENLWQSLYFLEGDLICWIDADIKNIHPRFVYGPIGVLLKNPKAGYVKGFYNRPLHFNKTKFPTGGGRVTEICIRPEFNLWFPELSNLIQPLSGEYAGRRKILEQIPFCIGYGVETKHLIDIWNKFGLEAIAQVNLKKRIHRNPSSVALGKMSFGIKKILYQELERLNYIKINKKIGKEYKIPINNQEKYSWEKQEIEDLIRPPIIKLKEYRKKFYKKE